MHLTKESYLTVNRGALKRNTHSEYKQPSGANIDGGANHKHW